MLVIVANLRDETAQWLADRWHDSGARVLTAMDLSTSGWRHYLPSSSDATAIAGGQKVATRQITGVLTRMPCVYEQELAHIIPADRSYVAAEMTAFLQAWLSGLQCPIVNRPTPSCLSGPNWRTEQWVCLAASLGIPAIPHRRKTPSTPDAVDNRQPAAEVVVVGKQSFGDVDSELADRARLLAKAAGVDLLGVHFTGSEPGSKFLDANLWPNIASVAVADAILELLSGRSSC